MTAGGRRRGPALAASGLAALCHCTFPEYSFAPDGGGGGGGGGAAGAATDGEGGTGDRSGDAGRAPDGAGRAGAAGAAGAPAPCPPDCPTVTIATALSPIISFELDATQLFWTQFVSPQSGDVLLTAPLAPDGSAPRTLLGPGSAPDPVLRGLDPAGLYLVAPRSSPAELLFFDRGAGSLRTALSFPRENRPESPDRVFVTDAVVYAATLDFLAGGDVLSAVPKAALAGPDAVPLPVTQTTGGDSLRVLGLDGDAVVFDTNDDSMPVRASRVSPDAPADVAPVFADRPPAPPVFFEFVGDAERTYWTSIDVANNQCLIQTLARGKDRLDDLQPVATGEPSCFDLRVDETHLYWLARDAEGARRLRAAPKDGSSPPQTVTEGVGAVGYAVRGGVAYWVTNDSRTVVGKRLR